MQGKERNLIQRLSLECTVFMNVRNCEKDFSIASNPFLLDSPSWWIIAILSVFSSLFATLENSVCNRFCDKNTDICKEKYAIKCSKDVSFHLFYFSSLPHESTKILEDSKKNHFNYTSQKDEYNNFQSLVECFVYSWVVCSSLRFKKKGSLWDLWIDSGWASQYQNILEIKNSCNYSRKTSGSAVFFQDISCKPLPKLSLAGLD